MRVSKCDLCGAIYDYSDKTEETCGEFNRHLKGVDVVIDEDGFENAYESLDLCPKCTKRVNEFIEVCEEYGFDRIEIVIKEKADAVHN